MCMQIKILTKPHKKTQKHNCVTTNTYSNRENYFSQKYENWQQPNNLKLTEISLTQISKVWGRWDKQKSQRNVKQTHNFLKLVVPWPVKNVKV